MHWPVAGSQMTSCWHWLTDAQVGLPVQTPPGLFVTEARPTGFGLGLGRARRNLLLLTFSDRAAGAS